MKIELIDDDFMVGDIFRMSDVNVYNRYDDSFRLFIKKIKNYEQKIVPVDFTDFEELTDHVFEEGADYTKVLSMNFPFFSEDQALLVLYSLTIKAQLGLRYLGYQLDETKTYLLSVKLHSKETFIIQISWWLNVIRFHAYHERYQRNAWEPGVIHLH